MNALNNTPRRMQGLTLVELCAALGVCAVLASQALPAIARLRQMQDLRGTAHALASDLRLARAEAARLSDSVFFRVSGKGANACYLLYAGERNDCDCAGGQAVCQSPGSTVIKAEWLDARRGLSLSSNAETLEFQHRQGLTTQTGSIEVRLTDGTAIRQVVAISGRVRSCASSGPVAGMPSCS